MKELWDRLGQVRTSQLRVEDGGTTREGSGTVSIHRADPSVIEWEERGSWRDQAGHETSYHDRLRWRLDAVAAVLSLYHLRQGEAHPVHLADLQNEGAGRFHSPLPHLCADDTYLAELKLTSGRIELHWDVRGPKKNYRVYRTYTLT